MEALEGEGQGLLEPSQVHPLLPENTAFLDGQSWRGKQTCPREVTPVPQQAWVWTHSCSGAPSPGPPRLLALPSWEASTLILEPLFLALTHIPT